MEKLGETVKQVLDDLSRKRGNDGAPSIQERFSSLLTAKEKEHASAMYFRKGILGVTVDSSSWMYYFITRKKDLLSGMSGHLKGLNDIKFTVGMTAK
jgi:hypothetical protein